jgi:putative transposase
VEKTHSQSSGELGRGWRRAVDILRFSQQQSKSLRTTNAIERLNGEFRRRVKTQGSLPSAQAAEFLLFGLIISGQIHMRRIDGWQELKQVCVLKAA